MPQSDPYSQEKKSYGAGHLEAQRTLFFTHNSCRILETGTTNPCLLLVFFYFTIVYDLDCEGIFETDEGRMREIGERERK